MPKPDADARLGGLKAPLPLRTRGQCARTNALLRASASVAFPPFHGARH